MTNEEIIDNYEKMTNEQAKIINAQAETIKGYEKIVKALPPMSPAALLHGLLGDVQSWENKVIEPQDEQERRQLFGARLKMVRQALGLKRSELAEKMKCSVPHIAAIEQGVKEPSVKNLVLLTKVLNTSADWLLGICPTH